MANPAGSNHGNVEPDKPSPRRRRFAEKAASNDAAGHHRPGVWPVKLLGILFIGLGAILAVGGGWLTALGGSPYYVAAGLLLIAAGGLLFQLNALGSVIYTAFLLLTAIWSFWEVGLNGWALVPRLLGASILMIFVIASLPVLWPARGKKAAISASAALLSVVSVATIMIWSSGPSRGPRLTAEMAGAMADPSLRETGVDWPAYGGTYSARRFSPLTQVNRDNVGQLKRAWTYRTGDLPDKKWGAETTPLKIGDTVYLCSARNILIALDASTGQQRWRYDPGVSDNNIPYTAACRGVSYFETPMDSRSQQAEPCSSRIIEGTLDARLIAVDARTGKLCGGFGQNGAVDITAGMGEIVPGMVSITSPPTIVRGVLVTGHQVLDGQKNNAPSGVVQGFDAVTGELRWAWDMNQPERTGLLGEDETYTRGTPNMWTTASGDEQLGLAYLPLGNSAADYYSSDRSEAENRYATSLVAVDVLTGKPAWSFQTVHRDVWDYDLGSQGTLIDYPTADGVIPAIILPSKQGDMYVLDRRTGANLTGGEERKVPQGGVEPDQRSPTQPFSTFHTVRSSDLREQDMWGMSPIDQMFCRISFRRAVYDGLYTAPRTDTHYIQYPSNNGGSDWGGIAVDPQRGLIIANYSDVPSLNRLVPRAEADSNGWYPVGDPRHKDIHAGSEGKPSPQTGIPYAVIVNAGWVAPVTGLLCKQPPYGGIRAIDMKSGKTVWDRPLGTARNNGPFGIPSMLPFNIGTPNNGGAVVTAGGLIFIAAATDNLIRAIDIETGKTVWSDVLPAGGQATPMVYEQGGLQYLVIMAGGHHYMGTARGDFVVAYTLPRVHQPRQAGTPE